MVCQGVKGARDFLGEVGPNLFGSHPYFGISIFGEPGDKSCCVFLHVFSFIFCDVQIFLRFNAWL